MTEVEPRPPDAARSSVVATAAARLAAIARSLRRWTFRLLLASAAAAAVIVYAIVRDGFPSGGKAVLAVVGIIAAVGPPVMLAAFALVLGEAIGLPERLRGLPLEAREHGEQLRYLLDQVRMSHGGRFRVPRLLWRLTRLAGSTRETLTPYAPLLPLLSLPFMAGAALAAFAAAIEILVATVVAVVLAVS
jgi:hypothetical protein